MSTTLTSLNTSAPEQTTVLTSARPSLTSAHYGQLIEKRGLPIDWVLANCRSVTTEQASELLGYKALSPGIWLQGANSQCQFRPDKPWSLDQARKAPKYRTPKDGDYDAMLPMHPTIKDYWHNLEALKERCWKIDGHPYIVATEGLFKAIAGCSNNIPTVALLGVEMGLTSAKADPQGKRYLVPALEKLARAGFGFIIGFDADCATNSDVIEAERKLTFWLKKFNVPVRSITGTWSVDKGKGMDDFIGQNGIEEFRKKLEDAYEKHWDEPEEKPKTKGSKLKASAKQIEEAIGKDLRWNELKRVVEYKGKELEADSHRLFIAQEIDIDVSEADATAILGDIAKRNSYHPIREYLDAVYVQYKDNLLPLEGLAKRLFGTDKEIHQIYLIRHLAGSVARIYKPGCKYDTALLLQGDQGVRKSTFFAELYYRDKGWFLEDLTPESAQGKDLLLLLHSFWSVEYSEIETTFTKKELSALKAFLALCFDTFREPYARREKRFDRQNTFCGSTNKPEFLQDETGNRRFMVIPVTVESIDTDWVKEVRDQLWATAVHLYRTGERCHLSKKEMAMQADDNVNYEVHDTWEDIIAPFLQCRESSTDPFVTTRQILHHIGFDDAQVTKKEEIRVGGIVQRLGWKRDRRTVEKVKVRGWIPGVKKNADEDEVFKWSRSNDQPASVPATVDQTQTIRDHLNLETFANSAEECLTNVAEKNESWPHQMVSMVSRENDKPETTVQQPSERFEDKQLFIAKHGRGGKDTYPNPKSDNDQSSFNRAMKLRKAMATANTKEDLSALRRENGGEFSQAEIKWVAAWIKALFPSEHAHMMATCNISQPSLLTPVPTTQQLKTEELLELLGWEEHQLDNYWDCEPFVVQGYSIKYLGGTILRWEVSQR